MARPENPHMSLEEWAKWIAENSGLENLSDETIARMMIGLREFERVVIEMTQKRLSFTPPRPY